MTDIHAQSLNIRAYSYTIHDPEVFADGLVGPYTDNQGKQWPRTEFRFEHFAFSAEPAVKHFDRKVTTEAGIGALLSAVQQADGEIEVAIEYVDAQERESIRRVSDVAVGEVHATIRQDDGSIRALRLDRIKAVSV